MRRFWTGVVLTLFGMAAVGQSATAGFVFGVQPSSGLIVRVDTTTGAVVGNLAPPVAVAANHTNLGLSLAEGGTSLLFMDSNVNSTLYRLDPTTGAVLSTHSTAGFATNGLSYEEIGGQDFVYLSHASTDVHRKGPGFNGGESFFFTPGSPVSLGGDGFGRQFVALTNGNIAEYNPSSGAVLNSFAGPSGVRGLAFDGTYLYVSNSNGQLLTLNASTGSVLTTVTVAGGGLFDLAAAPGVTAVPAPPAVLLGLLGATGATFGLRVRRTRTS